MEPPPPAKRVSAMQSVFCPAARRPVGRQADERGLAAAVGKKRIALSRCPGAALWGLNRGGYRGGRGLWPCDGRHGSVGGRSPLAAGMCEGRADVVRAVVRWCTGSWRHTRPATPRARRDSRRGRHMCAGHEVSGSAGHGHPRNQDRVTVMWPSAQTGQARSETPVSDS